MRDPELEARAFLNPEHQILDTKAALDGARYILMERFAEDAALLETLRGYLWQQGLLQARVQPGKEHEGAKFKDYFEHQEPLRSIPSHRTLAMLRGRNEGMLNLHMVTEQEGDTHPCEAMISYNFI